MSAATSSRSPATSAPYAGCASGTTRARRGRVGWARTRPGVCSPAGLCRRGAMTACWGCLLGSGRRGRRWRVQPRRRHLPGDHRHQDHQGQRARQHGQIPPHRIPQRSGTAGAAEQRHQIHKGDDRHFDHEYPRLRFGHSPATLRRRCDTVTEWSPPTRDTTAPNGGDCRAGSATATTTTARSAGPVAPWAPLPLTTSSAHSKADRFGTWPTCAPRAATATVLALNGWRCDAAPATAPR